MQSTGTNSALVLLGRVFWMFLGPMILVFLGYSIVRIGNGWFTPADIAFLVVVGVLVLARWLEVRGGNPQTASGEPATPEQFRRYILLAPLVGIMVWIGANLIGNHWLAR